MKHTIKRTILAAGMALVLSVVTTPPVVAGPLQLRDTPLFIDLGVEPNVVVTLDDSGTMGRCYVLNDAISTSSVFEKKGMTAYQVNALAYNPNITYEVPVDDTGLSLGEPNFNDAWEDGYASNRSSNKKTLNNDFEPCWTPLTDYKSNPINAESAYYHTFSGDPKNDSSVDNQSNYTKVPIGAAEEQNFANWFSYYRNRLLTMKSAAGRVFTDPALTGRIRLGYTAMWGYQGEAKDQMGPISLMRKYEGAGRTAFLNWLYAKQNKGGTPLPKAMNRAGHYYMDEDPDGSTFTNWLAMNPVDSPWAFEPGVTKDPEFTCRQAFQVFMTDGAWNSDEERMGVLGNIDNTAVAYPEPLDVPGTMTNYTPYAPYKDDNTITFGGNDYGYLADNAFYYWVNDLRPDLANDVPRYMPDPTLHPDPTKGAEGNPKNDPATWQHMVNFTVGFGVDGDLAFPDDYDDVLDGTKDWNGGDKVDDLWHAAINSRGQYLSAKNPDDLVNAFGSALNAVLARTSSGSAVALNSGSLEAGSRVYQARFTSGDWSGKVLGFDINPANGQVVQPEVWDASLKLATRISGNGWDTNREIITYDGTQGVPFRWGNLTAGQQTDLNTDHTGAPDAEGPARLNYLRGDDADETPNGNKYRARAGALGDVINSAPAYIGVPPFNYPDSLESGGEKYSDFKSTHTTRAPMIYTGANDGMLHGFNGDTGEEVLAYVPSAVYPNLSQLTAINYGHRFFVDGTPTVGDAFWGNAWHTVVVGGLRKGSQAIYALDVTNPSALSEANASSVVLWEYTDADDADLGYTYSRPAIVRMHNNKWAAVFGNGYNNTEADGNTSSLGRAVLYIVDIATGALLQRIDTGVGTAQDPTGTGRPNGLATVSPVDVDGDRTVDYIYGGDLFGNMWKFDVRDPTPLNWDIAYQLFTATDDSGVAQAITTRPEVGLHPDSGKTGYMVYFGTGKYIESGDNITGGTQTQTFYGIWDPDSGAPPYDRMPGLPNLLEQTIDDEITAFGAEVRLVSDNTIAWASNPYSPGGGEHIGWYMDLLNQEGGNTDPMGERQVTTSVLADGRIIFTTLIPSGSSCVFGGDGWLMELDAADGSRLAEPPFDLDNDGDFDLVNDGSGNSVAPGGIKSTGGAPSSPAILDAGDGQEYKYVSGTDDGSIQVISEQKGDDCTGCAGTRESWLQLR